MAPRKNPTQRSRARANGSPPPSTILPMDKTAPDLAPAGRIRLVRVVIQAELAWDTGDELTPLNPQMTAIPGSEWPLYSSERFPHELGMMELQANADPKFLHSLIPEVQK